MDSPPPPRITSWLATLMAVNGGEARACAVSSNDEVAREDRSVEGHRRVHQLITSPTISSTNNLLLSFFFVIPPPLFAQ